MVILLSHNCKTYIINIYEAYEREQEFSQIKNCFVRVSDMDTGRELVWYDVNGNFDGMTGIFVADIYYCNGEWKFKAVGEGVKVKSIKKMVKRRLGN